VAGRGEQATAGGTPRVPAGLECPTGGFEVLAETVEGALNELWDADKHRVILAMASSHAHGATLSVSGDDRVRR
jgi:hypothetical protein